MKFKTTKQIAQEKGLSRSQINAMLRKKKIKGIKPSRNWLIPTEPLMEKEKQFTTLRELYDKGKTGYSLSHLRWLVRNGKLKAEKYGRDYIITDLNQEFRYKKGTKGVTKWEEAEER